MFKFDFFLKAEYCNTTVNQHSAIKKMQPSEETRQWFKEQGLTLYTIYESEIGCVCSVDNITEEQAITIQLTYNIKAEHGELRKSNLRLTL
jgi:hypothetical protein